MQSWALDFTLKTNQYDLPLYVTIVPNQYGQGMPIFYMLCLRTKNQVKKDMQLKFVLKSCLKRLKMLDHQALLSTSTSQLSMSSRWWWVKIWHQIHILMYFDNENNFDEKVFNFTNMEGVESVILVNNSIRKTHHFNIGLWWDANCSHAQLMCTSWTPCN